MRPPGAILSLGESIATVSKFVEHPENNEKPLLDQKNKVKFKIMSLKVKGPMEYVPELLLLQGYGQLKKENTPVQATGMF
ncbi:vesicle-associated protein 4-2-like [Dendrobium catenatum]|uniref:vesicle-associated protein 4-2-like n=1 Tax=Dendrobium catenatum TaxID=906689 RepID=UPI00109F9B43|nr:vesicle-associated protein 4-2-like [Dendrobium catenatum]